MTLDRLQRCCSYSLVGVVIGYAIAFSGGDAFAQTPCSPGQVCIHEIPTLKPHPGNPFGKLIRELQKLYPKAIHQLEREDPQAIEKLRQLDPQTLQRLQQLAPNSRQQLQQYAQ